MSRIYAPNRIAELRIAKGLTQQDVADRIGGTTTKGTVSKLEKRTMGCTVDHIFDLARALEVDPSEIIVKVEPGAREVPLLGRVAAGNWREAIADADEFVAVPEKISGKNLFALRVDGDSMNTIVPDGSIIVVNPDDLDLVDGRVYVIANGHHETTFKQFSANPPRLLPCSTNPVHQPIEIGREPFITVGRVSYASFRL